MSKIVLLFGFIFTCIISVSAQTGNVGIGTATPNGTSKLDITASDKGMLIPRVALTSTTSASPITKADGSAATTGDLATPLLVYNTASSGSGSTAVSPGFYYWGGSSWIRFLSGNSAIYDLGYILAWTSNTAPPEYLLPLSGGTYNWSDYPDFQTFNTTYPSQFIASSNASTFTLKDINSSTQRFLRGGTSAGVTQAQSTALPTTSFTTNSAGSHDHGRGGTGSVGNGNWGLIKQSDGGSNTTNCVDATAGEPNIVTSPRELGLASDGAHTHTITGGGDAETRPANISTVWCLKVKPTGYVGTVNINNGTAAGATNGLSTYASQIGLGGTLNQNTTINMAGFNTSFNGTGGVGIGTTTIPAESRLVLGATDAINEGGQLQLNAPGGSYTTAYHIDNYQNTLRVMSGTNSGSSTLELSMESNGDLRLSNNNTLHMPNNVAYLVDRSEKTQDATNSGFRTVGGSTSNLAVSSGDIIIIKVTLKFAFTNGSSNDDVIFRININNVSGCSSTSQTESYYYENYDNDRNEYQPISMQFVYVAPCTGTINFQLSSDNNSVADDNSKYGDIVIVATKY